MNLGEVQIPDEVQLPEPVMVMPTLPPVEECPVVGVAVQSDSYVYVQSSPIHKLNLPLPNLIGMYFRSY